MRNISKPIYTESWTVEVYTDEDPDNLGAHEFETEEEAEEFRAKLIKAQKAPTGMNTSSHNIIYYMRNMAESLEAIKGLLVDIQENTEMMR